MTTLREAAQQALEALDCPGKAKTTDEQAAITALRAALEQPEQGAVAMLWKAQRLNAAEAVNQELLEALKGLMPIAKWDGGRFDANTIGDAAMPEFVAARAAIAKAEGQA